MQNRKTEKELIESFVQMRDNHADVQSVYNIISEAMVAEMASDGITIQPHDLIKLSSFRAAVLANDPELLGPWREEAERLIPAAVEAKQMKELHAALNDTENTEEFEQAVDQFSGLSPTERMAKFRALNAAAAGASPSQPAAATNTMTPQEKAAKLRQLQDMPVSLRMAKAREWNMA